MKKALITGITGQDGSLLARLLLSKGFEVHGIIRRSSTFNTTRIDDIFDQLQLYHGDLSDSGVIDSIVKKVQPDFVYHLGAQSHVKVSFEMPEYTADVDALGTLRVLEAIREHCPGARFYNAGSSEMYGQTPPPQNEETTFDPQSPYACTKVFSYQMTRLYRRAYDLFASNGILFNHESEYRGETFVTRKITRAVARIHQGLQDELRLGNLESRRDWGYAGDYVKAMVLMLDHDEPDDFVIATGKSYSVKDFVQRAFDWADIPNWEEYVVIDPKYFRPAEVDYLHGDYSKAKRVLGWEPETDIDALVDIMMTHDLRLAKQERILADAQT